MNVVGSGGGFGFGGIQVFLNSLGLFRSLAPLLLVYLVGVFAVGLLGSFWNSVSPAKSKGALKNLDAKRDLAWKDWKEGKLNTPQLNKSMNNYDKLDKERAKAMEKKRQAWESAYKQGKMNQARYQKGIEVLNGKPAHSGHHHHGRTNSSKAGKSTRSSHHKVTSIR